MNPMNTMKALDLIAVALLSTFGSACSGSRTAAREPTTGSESTVAAELATFRSGIVSPPDVLAGAPSRDSLMRAFAHALAKNDTARLNDLQITRAEFAYLYYPDSKLARLPYELDPQTMWMQIESQRDRGLKRLVARYGGGKLRIRSLNCQPPESQNRIVLHECAVVTRGDTVPQQLFGSILQRDGRFKFVGLANRL